MASKFEELHPKPLIEEQYVKPFAVGEAEIETNEYVGLSWVWNF